MYEIIKQLGINYAFDDNSNAFKLAGSVLEALTGRNINGIIENLKSDNPLTKIKEEKDLHENIKNFFTELLVERGNRLVVFIDELEPNTSIKVVFLFHLKKKNQIFYSHV